MMQEDYVTFEQAKLLKEKGFPQDEYGPQYKENGEIENGFTDLGLGIYYVPTLSLVQKWLREIHNIEVLEFIHLVPNESSYNIGDKRWVYKVENKLYKRYEQALSECIDKVLKLI